MATGKIVFKEESYQVFGVFFEVCKEKGNRFRAFRVFRSFKILEANKLIQWTLVPCATDHGVTSVYTKRAAILHAGCKLLAVH